jgi:hypothetical protein
MPLIFSPHSNSSEQVLREVQLAVDSHFAHRITKLVPI